MIHLVQLNGWIGWLHFVTLPPLLDLCFCSGSHTSSDQKRFRNSGQLHNNWFPLVIFKWVKYIILVFRNFNLTEFLWFSSESRIDTHDHHWCVENLGWTTSKNNVYLWNHDQELHFHLSSFTFHKHHYSKIYFLVCFEENSRNGWRQSR